MSGNEVNFKVTGEYRAGPDFDKAREDQTKLREETKKTNEETKKQTDTTKKQSEEQKRVAEILGVYRTRAREAAKGTSELDKEINALKTSTLLLGKEFERTGDADVFKAFRKSSAELSGLKSARKEIEGLEDDAKKAAKAGGTFASAFEGGILDAIRGLPSEAKMALAATGAGIIAVLGPIVGAGVAAGVLGGVGGGGLVAGIKLAAKDPAVAAAWSEVGGRISDRLDKSVDPFKAKLIGTSSIFEDAFNRNAPRLDNIFANLAPKITPLAEAIGKTVDAALPGIERASAAAGPLLDKAAEDLPKIGGAIGDFADMMANAGPGATLFFDEMLKSIAATIEGLGLMVEGLGQTMSSVAGVANALGLWDPGVPAHFGEELNRAAGNAADFGDQASTAFYNTAEAADLLNDAFKRLFDEQTGLMEANLAVKEGLLELRKTLGENRGAWSDATEAGLKHRQALLDQAEAYARQRDAAIAAGNGTKEATDAANAAYANNIAGLIKLAAQFGISEAAVRAFLGPLLGIPDKITKTVDIRVNEYHNYYTNGAPIGPEERKYGPGGKASGGITGAASGRAVGGGMLAVAEQGRELALLAPGYASLPPGSQILSNPDTQRAMSGASAAGQGGDARPAFVLGSDGSAIGDAIIELIRESMRRQGGDADLLGIKAN